MNESVADYIPDFLKKFPKTEQETALMVVRVLLTIYGGKMEEVSMQLYNKDSYFNGKDALFPLKGYHGVTSVLSEDVPIQLNHAVTSIKLLDNGEEVEVTCENGKRVHAEHVVVTVSLGVLKANLIEFVPDLPKPKKEAITRIGFSNYHKIYIEFSEAFWDMSLD